MLTPIENECRNFILLLTDITWTVTLLGPLRYSKVTCENISFVMRDNATELIFLKVVVVTVSSRWKIEEYLAGWQARDIVNLLIVSYNWKQNVLFSVVGLVCQDDHFMHMLRSALINKLIIPNDFDSNFRKRSTTE